MTQVLTARGTKVADASVWTVQVQPMIGGYELLVVLEITAIVRPTQFPGVILHGARATLTASGGQRQTLGSLSVPYPIRIQPTEHPNRKNVEFRLPLSPQQVAAIEDLRAGGDLLLTITPYSQAVDQSGLAEDNVEWHDLQHRIPQSEWIAILRSAQASDIFVLEVGAIEHPIAPSLKRYLEDAQRHLAAGNHRDCVLACRHALEEVLAGEGVDLFRPILGDRKAMTQAEREGVVAASVQHLANLSAHSTARGGNLDYTRSGAKNVLALTTAVVAMLVAR